MSHEGLIHPEGVADAPVGVAVIGVGGYGTEIIQAIESFGPSLNNPLRLTAVCDVSPERCADVIDGLSLKGVQVHRSAKAIAENPEVDAVWLPLPIHLHAEYTAMMLAAGKAVMCEKPAAGSLAEVDDMIRARNAFGRPVLVGFQEIYDPWTYRLKQLLISGEFGKLRRITVRACWPRTSAYFRRNSWAGRREVEGRPVHDSPLNNALSHFANLALFFAGPELNAAAMPTGVQAKTYRSAAIENYDTAMVYARVGDEADMVLWLTHASRDNVDPVMRIECEGASITRYMNEIVLEIADKQPERWPMAARDLRPTLEALGAAVRGRPPVDQVWATLELARPHVALVEEVSRVPIMEVPRSLLDRVGSRHEQVRAVRGISAWFEDLEKDAITAVALGHRPTRAQVASWLSLPAWSDAPASVRPV